MVWRFRCARSFRIQDRYRFRAAPSEAGRRHARNPRAFRSDVRGQAPWHGNHSRISSLETARPPRWQNTTRLAWRSEEHTSELQSLMRISYAVFCLKKTKEKYKIHHIHTHNIHRHK